MLDLKRFDMPGWPSGLRRRTILAEEASVRTSGGKKVRKFAKPVCESTRGFESVDERIIFREIPFPGAF